MRFLKLIGIVFAFIAGGITLLLASGTQPVEAHELATLFLDNYMADTGAQNSVASIYLNYRIFDTIFEALMLLVCVMGVIHFSRHSDDSIPLHHHVVYTDTDDDRSKSSIGAVIPIILLLGAYLIVNGHNTPGGGFQGGAALSASLICIYLVRPHKTIDFMVYESFEKRTFLLIALFAMSFAVSNIYFMFPQFNVLYMFVMNLLIGFKVFCGLSIVFYRFVHYEDV